MQKYKYLIFDTNNLFRLSFGSLIDENNKHKLLKEGYTIYPLAIKEAIANINSIVERYGCPDSKIYLLYDNPTTVINIRKIISEGKYKSARDKKGINKQLYVTLDLLIEITLHYSDNWNILRGESLEADDLTYPLIKKLDISKDSPCLLISHDKDWARNLDNNIHWFNWKSVYDVNSYTNKYGYNPIGKKIQLDKSIKGDSADSIKAGLPHLPKDLFLHVMNRYNTVEDFIKNYHTDNELKNWKTKIANHSKDLRKNYALTDFMIFNGDIETIIEKSKRDAIWLNLWYSFLGLKPEYWFELHDNKPSFDFTGTFMP